MLVIFHVFLILGLCFVLYKASEWLIEAIRTVADGGFLGKFLLASIFAGFFSATPEIFVSITSSLEGTPHIAFGNAIGSNIANLGLVFTLAILISPMRIIVRNEDFSLKTVFMLMTAALFPFLLALDGSLSRVDGFFLISLFFLYSLYVFNKRPSFRTGLHNFFLRLEESLQKRKVRQAVMVIVGSVALLLVSSHFLVRSAIFLAEALSVRPFLIALFVIAPGTSLPELFVALTSIRKKEFDVLYGDIFGSLVTNANFVVGISALIHPYALRVFPEYLISLLGLLTIFVLFIIFSMTKRRFERWEAAVLFLTYIVFFLAESL